MPVAIPAIALAVAAIGTGVAVAGQRQATKAQEQTAEFNAKVEENNALAAQQQAEAEALQVRRMNRLRAGSQRAAYGKAGVDVSGAGDVLYDTGVQGELEALSTLYAGRTQAAYYQSRASGSRFEGQNARTAGRYNTAATIIGGASQMAGIAGRAYGGGRTGQPSFN